MSVAQIAVNTRAQSLRQHLQMMISSKPLPSKQESAAFVTEAEEYLRGLDEVRGSRHAKDNR